jgi:hypothetical protein
MNAAKRISLTVSSMMLALVTGCVNPFTTTTTVSSSSPQVPASPNNGAPPAAPVAQGAAGGFGSMMFGAAPTQTSLARKVLVAWNNQIVTTPDPVNGNRETPGLAGRLYVFGDDEGHPLVAPGAVAVCVRAVDREGKTGPALATWSFDSVSLQRLGRKDAIGHGYTLFLPWLEYKPEIVRVQLDVRYLPDGGQPLFAPTTTMSLHQDGTPMMNTSQLVPAANVPSANRR